VLRGGEPVGVTFLSANGDPLGMAHAVELLLDVGWRSGNIALLTTGSRYPGQVQRTELHGQHGYWRTYAGGDDFYVHVLGCKGLEGQRWCFASTSRKPVTARERSSTLGCGAPPIS
jgi:hypothetical protein